MSKASIEVIKLEKQYAGKTLFDSISFKVNHGEKTALTGLNGCGKSTLLKIIASLECPDDGKVKTTPPKAKIGYLPQWIEFDEKTLGAVVEKAFQNAGVKEQWQKDVKTEEILTLTGLEDMALDFPTAKMSGGEKTRACLASLLTREPDFLLLDEPTNFLDIDGLKWMENLVKELKQGVLMVSHDRYFIDKTVSRVIEIDHGRLFEYSGGYTDYRRQKAQRTERHWSDYKAYKKERRRLKAVAQRHKDSAKYNESRTQNDQARRLAKKVAKKGKAVDKRIQQLEKVDKPRRNYMAGIKLNGSASSRIVARVEDVSKAYGERVLYDNVNFNIQAGQKIGIVGANGSGKTTLLKILMGEESPTSGSVNLLPKERIGYFSQLFEGLDPDTRVLNTLMDHSRMQKGEARQLLASFLFLGDSVFKTVDKLSIGERSRLVLACLKSVEPEVLILDEPTSHLDVDTTEILENALAEFSGTVLIVTHDRFLLDNVVSHLLVIENRQVAEYPGNYSYHTDKKNRETQQGQSKAAHDDERLLTECRLSQISAMLSRSDISDEQRTELNREFENLKSKM